MTGITIPFASGPVEDRRPRLLDDVELMAIPDLAWTIAGVQPARGLGVTYGPPGSCKTTLEIGKAIAIATAGQWFGFEVMQQGASILIVAEDLPGAKLRVRAGKRAAGLALDVPIGVYVWPDVVDLRDTAAVDRFIAMAHEQRGAFVQVVIDTYAAATPGAAENSSEDMTLAVGNARRIADALKLWVQLVHHSNAGGTRERGHSSMRGAADMMMAIAEVDGAIHVECSKQRNGPMFDTLRLRLVPSDGGGCVLRPLTDGGPSDALTPAQSKALAILREISQTDGVTKTEWKNACNLPERTFFSATGVLEKRGYAVKTGTHFRVGGGSR